MTSCILTCILLPLPFRSVAPVLLPRGMSVLLALAETSQKLEDLPSRTEIDNENKWKSTVTALNVLRQAFVDAPLADDIGPYVTQVPHRHSSRENSANKQNQFNGDGTSYRSCKE